MIINIIEIEMRNKVHSDSQYREAGDRITPGVLVRKIVSGGQTGVDRAALDAAVLLGCASGGWCPRGRIAEDGRIPLDYPLMETTDAVYEQRTEWNVRDSDGTLVLTPHPPTSGTAFTILKAREFGRPLFCIDPGSMPDVVSFREWIHRNGIHVLNIAGPRESAIPGIYERTVAILRQLLPSVTGSTQG